MAPFDDTRNAPPADDGYAAAVRPIVGSTVLHTDAAGLEAGPVVIRSGAFDMPAYRACPQGGADLPVLLVVSEIFGLHEHIADMARRFAKQGFLAIAPDLFRRQGDATAYTDIDRLFSELVDKVPDAQVMGDLDAAMDWAGNHGGDLARLGVTGFCWGGRITWLWTAHQPKVRAGVAWYGKLQPPTTTLQPHTPVDVAGHLHAPVLGLYGGKDTSIPAPQVEAMKAALAKGNAAARASQIVVYPDAGHAFNADYRPSYRRPDAEDGWRRCLDWLVRHGVK
jgi:carboxymethylenebutenolidase